MNIPAGYAVNYGTGSNGSITLSAVPEPCTLALLGVGAVGLSGYGSWRRRAATRAMTPTAFVQQSLARGRRDPARRAASVCGLGFGLATRIASEVSRCMPTDYYKMLGVPHNASQVEIHKAYRDLARRYHPDTNPDGDSAQRFREVQAAFDALNDPDKREMYDRYGIPFDPYHRWLGIQKSSNRRATTGSWDWPRSRPIWGSSLMRRSSFAHIARSASFPSRRESANREEDY